MKKRLDILKWLTLIVVLLATACGHDDILPPDVYQEEPYTPYVEVRIAIPVANPTGTRANPMGGEEGNGRERGVLHEDDIHDINVFFFLEGKDASWNALGMDSNDETKIIKHIYYNIDNPKDPVNTPLVTVNENYDQSVSDHLEYGYLTLRFECTEEELNHATSSGIYFVVIANVGPLQSETLSTLGALRNINLADYTTNAWSKTYDDFSKDASKMDYFLMSTAYNANYNGTGDNKIAKRGDNYTGVTTLQRMYARLDLWYNENKNALKTGTGNDAKITELKYGIIDDNGNEVKYIENDGDGKDVSKDVANVYVTNVLPVNVMQKPSYLFKKVIQLPAETTAWNALTNNTVWNKTSNVWIEGTYKWGGKESPNNIPTATAGNDLPLNYVMERHTLEKSNGGGGNYESWYGKSSKSKVIEAIQKDLGNAETNTDNGKFSAYYHMDRSAAGSDPDYGCDHISIIGYANENTHPTDCFHSNYLTGLAFRAVYVPAKIYSGYSDTETKDVNGKTVWSYIELSGTPEKIYRYSPTDRYRDESVCLYFSDKNVAENYAKANPGDMAIITEYSTTQHDGKWGFICYYNLWLRHYNDENADPQATYPMEYATVRNNIYRVSVSFQGPGDPTPTMREPDTMKARIFVRKWNYKEEPTIIF